jgi:hypothetical protein
MFRSILVAVDGSCEAAKALEEAVDLARSEGARLTLISVAELPRWRFSGFPLAVPFPDEAELVREAERIVEQAEELVPEDVPVSTVVVWARPARSSSGASAGPCSPAAPFRCSSRRPCPHVRTGSSRWRSLERIAADAGQRADGVSLGDGGVHRRHGDRLVDLRPDVLHLETTYDPYKCQVPRTRRPAGLDSATLTDPRGCVKWVPTVG